MRLREFLNGRFVLHHLSGRDVDDIVGEVANRAAEAGIAPAELVREKLLEREREHPTVMGPGLAIPHATVPGVEGPTVGVALAPEPVRFGGEEMDPVQVFFILLSPPGHEREHIKLLARICRLARHDDFLTRLTGTEDEADLLEAVTALDDQNA